MTGAPERIWVEPGLPGYTHEPNVVYTVEYVRADLARPMTVAEAAKVLLDEMGATTRSKVWEATKGAPPEFGGWFYDALLVLAEGDT